MAWISFHAGSASAGPGVIVAPRVDAFAEPSDSAEVVAELGRGARILVFENESSTEVKYRPGWVAIRIPGSGGVGYVRADAVDHVAAGSEDSAPRPRAWSPPPPSPLPREPETATTVSASEMRAGRFLPLKPARLQLSVGSGVAWLRPESAEKNRIHGAGPTLNVSCALLIADIVSLSADVGGIFPSDDGSFSQVVEPIEGGEARTADSSASVTRYAVAVGLRTPFLALSETEHGWLAGAVHAHVGRAEIDGGRSISMCVDCREDEFSFPGGAFWRVGVDLTAPSSRWFRYGLTAAYQGYLGDAGITDEVQINATLSW
jgi:hypothetical protein